jgi:predicted nucleotidyltransferase
MDPQLPEEFDVPLLAVTGSRAYGTERPDSDWDYRGVFVRPTEDLLRLRGMPDNWDRGKGSDITLYELRKFCKLAADANPTILEVLWCDEFVRRDEVGDLLVRSRDLFLSRRISRTYGGYAMQQLKKGLKGTGGSRGVSHHKRRKAKLHTMRLLEAGIHALKTGEVMVRVPDPDRLWEMADWSWQKLEERFMLLDFGIKTEVNDSPLPEYPDYDAIDDLLLEIRAMRWTKAVS